MINAYYSDKFITPLLDFGISKGFNLSTHTGLDWAWVENAGAPIYPIQDGKVVDVFYSDSCGYACVVQHDYSDGTHRFSAYLHMKAKASVSVGQLVKALNNSDATVLGYRGNTGVSSGPHLHLYVTTKTTKTYNWNLLGHSYKTHICTFDPTSYFYRIKARSYKGITAPKWPAYEDIPAPVAYPTAVERDIKKDQIEIKGATQLLLREGPGKSFKSYDEYASNGIFNLLSTKDADGYTWCQIGEKFWVAKLGYVTIMPAVKFPEPVGRNNMVPQCEVLKDIVLLRDDNLNTYNEYIKKGIYNILDKKTANLNDVTYVWYKVAEGFWFASGGGRSKDLDVVNDKNTIEELKKKIEQMAEVQVQLEEQLGKKESELNLKTTECTIAQNNLKVANEKLTKIDSILHEQH